MTSKCSLLDILQKTKHTHECAKECTDMHTQQPHGHHWHLEIVHTVGGIY